MPGSRTQHTDRNSPSGTIRAGVGGWVYEPWRGTFYPEGLRQADELNYAASKLTAIEINATFYRLQKPDSFSKWAAATPENFRFSVKGSRYVTYRNVLAEAGEPLQRFFGSGLTELGDKLGPIVWQFAPTKQFDEADLGGFLELLPRELDGRKLHHVLEVRHPSFQAESFVRLARKFGVAIAYTDAEDWPRIPDLTGEVVYARLQRGDESLPAAYPPAALDAWAERAKDWARGLAPSGLPLVDPGTPATPAPRDVFIYFIHEAKLRAPAAAMALIERL